LFIRASLEAGGVEATSSKEEIRMKLHANHRTCPSSRRLICERVLEQRWSLRRAAEAAGCSERTAAKWLARYRAGDQQLCDRSSRPHRCPRRLPADRVVAIERLRRVRMTASEIAEVLELPVSTVSLWLRRIGLGKRSRLEPPEPPNRYERRHPGELVHVDIKQLGRIRGIGHRISGNRASQKRTRHHGRLTGVAGWEYLHVIIDDHSRLAYAGSSRPSPPKTPPPSSAGRSPGIPPEASPCVQS
jgi:DNA-directed RNA polymerase specialized sigma24 family protein